MNERRFTSEDTPEVSGEIGGEKERPEPSAAEKREARITKYQELLSKQEEKLAALDTEAVKEKARKTYEDALARGNDPDMANRLKEAMEKNLEEEAADVSGLIEDIKGNISKLESGQDDLYSPEQ